MQTLSIQEVVAINETPKANALLIRYGYKPAKNIDNLIRELFRFTRDYREVALEELANIHPHRKLILHFNENNMFKENRSRRIGDRFSSFEMEEQIDFLGSKSNDNTQKNPMQTINEYLPLIAVAGIFALTITAISK